VNSRRAFLKSLGVTVGVGAALLISPEKETTSIEEEYGYSLWDRARENQSSSSQFKEGMSLGKMLQKVYNDSITEQLTAELRSVRRML